MYYFILGVIALIAILLAFRFWKNIDETEAELTKANEATEYERVSHNETKNRMKTIEAEYEQAIRDKNAAITIQKALEEQIRERDALLASNIRLGEASLTSSVSESVIITTPDEDPADDCGVSEWEYSRAPRNVRRTITIAAFEKEFAEKPVWLVEFSSEFLKNHPKVLRMFTHQLRPVMAKVKKDGSVVVAGTD